MYEWHDHAVVGPTSNALDATHWLSLVRISLYIHPIGGEVVGSDASNVVLLGDLCDSTT